MPSSFDDVLLRRVAADYPLPIADAAAFVLARTEPHARLLAALDLFRAALRMVASLALGARLQFGPGPGEAEGEVRDLLQTLWRRGLTEGQWVQLARTLLRGWAGAPERHALPELVASFEKAGGLERAIDGILAVRNRVAHRTASLDAEVASLEAALAGPLAKLLESLEPVFARYALAASVGGGRARELMGCTPPRGMWRVREVPDAGEAVRDGVVVLDGEGRARLSLAPIVRLLEPVEGAVAELFFLDGCKRRTATLVAMPSGALREAPDVWDAVQALLAADDKDSDRGAAGERPYRGLSSFRAEDAPLFFGREELTDEIANRIRAHALVTLTGPSGVGKTSLLAAGVIPALGRVAERQVQLGVSPYRAPIGELTVVLLRPGPDAIGAITRRLGELLGEEVTADTVDRLVRAWAGDSRTLLLVVDQVEELVTLERDAAARQAFAAILAALGTDDQGPSRVVISVRGDFFHRLAELGPLTGRFERHARVLAVPDRDALLRILREPAARFGFRFDEGLAERMVAEVEAEPAALALLSFCADRLWDGRDRAWKRLTLDEYEAMGGVAGALAGHADALVDAMPAAQAGVARHLLLRLVTPEGTRAVVPRRELIDGCARPDQAEHVLAALTEGRLLSAREAEVDDGTVELAHEALITHWDRLRRWREEDRESQRHLADLRDAARRWEARGRSPDALLRRDLLAAHRRFLRTSDLPLTRLERDFAGASERAERRARRGRLGAVLIALAAFAAAAAVAFAGWSDADDERGRAEAREAEASRQRRRAEFRGLLALANQNAAERPEHALALLRAAVSHAAGEDGRLGVLERQDVLRSGLLPLLDRPLGIVLPGPATIPARFSPDGRRLATSSLEGGVVRLWDAATGALLRTLSGHRGFVSALAFSPDGRRLATANEDEHGAFVWDAATGRRLRTLRPESAEDGGVIGVAFSPDGRSLVTVPRFRRARLWDAATGRLIRSLEGDDTGQGPAVDVAAIAFSADGRRITVLGGSELFVWNAASGALVRRESFHPPGSLSADGRWVARWADEPGPAVLVVDAATGEVRRAYRTAARPEALAISPDGDRLAFAERSVIRVLDVDGGEELGRFFHDQPETIRFSAEGRAVAIGGRHAVSVWDTGTGARIRLLSIPGGQISHQMLLAPAADRLAVARLDQVGTVRLFDVDHRAFDSFRLGNGRGGRVHYAGRRRLVTTSSHGAAVWDAETGDHRRTLTGAAVSESAFTPDGVRLAVLPETGPLRVWDFRTGAELPPIERPEMRVGELVLAPDGTRLAAVLEGSVRIWEVGSGTHLRDVELPEPLTAAFSPDGRRITIGGELPDVHVRDVDTGAPLLTLPGHIGRVRSIVDSGARIVTAAENGTVHFWDAATGAPLRSTMAHPGGARLILSPVRSFVGSAGNVTARLWSVDDGTLLHTLEGHRDEISAMRFSPDGGLFVTASRDAAVRVWDTASGALLQVIDEVSVADLAIAPGGDRVALRSGGRLGAIYPIRGPDIEPPLRESAGRSNLRVCLDSFVVVPVELRQGADPVWANFSSGGEACPAW